MTTQIKFTTAEEAVRLSNNRATTYTSESKGFGSQCSYQRHVARGGGR